MVILCAKSRPFRIVVGLLLLAVWLPQARAQEYVIGPGDVLTISGWGHPGLSRACTVAPAGFAPFPLINRVKAGGLTTRQVAASLADLLGKDYLVNPQVIVSVKEYQSQKVTILGETSRPGVYYLTGPTSLVDVRSKAGGLSKNAGKQISRVECRPVSCPGQ